jgi:site-specific DNA recombinase
MKIIALYGRVSTSRQENEETIQNQLHAIKEFADKKYVDEGGYKIVREYTDEGWSGDTLIRPELDNLRLDAKKKLWDTVIIYDPDRLARRYSYQELVIDELKEEGIEVLFVTIKPPENEEDRILYGVRGLFSQYERAKIAERFRQGKLRKARGGHLMVSESLYGYRYIPNKESSDHQKIHGHYEIDPEESKVVIMIFEWVAIERLTMRKIIKRLQDLGIKPRKSKRGVWSSSTLTSMLRNEGYTGQAHWGSTYATVPENPRSKEKYRKIKKSSRKFKPREDWFIIEIPPLISKDLFDRARHQIGINFKMHPRNRKNDYLLAGMIRCTCGRSRAGEGPKQGTHLYYRCSDRVSSYPLPRTCHRNGINARIADKLVWDRLVELSTSQSLIREEVGKWGQKNQETVDTPVPDFKKVEQEIKKLKKEEDRYNRAYGEGVFSVSQLKEYLSPLREKITILEASMRVEPRREADRAEILAELVKTCQISLEAPRVFFENLDFSEKREIITRSIDQIVGDQERLNVKGHLLLNPHVEDHSDNNKGVLSLIPSSYVGYKLNHRNRRPAKRREIDAF